MDLGLRGIEDVASLKMSTPDVHRIGFSPEGMRHDSDLGDRLEGDIISGVSSKGAAVVEGELNTLDEPIVDTIKRDLKAIGNKIWNAMMPTKDPKFLLVEWDLWGTLFFATFLGILLQHMNSNDPYASQFTQIILIVCLGTGAVTYSHVVMLRTSISIFQYISVLGYCLAPMAISLLITFLLDFLIGRPFMIRFILFLASTGWAIYATSLILKPANEGPLNIPYHLAPIAVYFTIIGLLILYHTGSDAASSTPVPVPVQVTTGKP